MFRSFSPCSLCLRGYSLWRDVSCVLAPRTKKASAHSASAARCFHLCKRTRDGAQGKTPKSRRRLFSRFGCKRPQIPSSLNSTARRGKSQATSGRFLHFAAILAPDKETGRHGDKEKSSCASPCLPVSPSIDTAAVVRFHRLPYHGTTSDTPR